MFPKNSESHTFLIILEEYKESNALAKERINVRLEKSVIGSSFVKKSFSYLFKVGVIPARICLFCKRDMPMKI